MAARRPANPHRLGDRGLKLFRDITKSRTLTLLEEEQLVEACRIADRLAKLNDLIDGSEDAWFRLKLPRADDGVIEVLINDPMKEARMHAAAFRQLMAPFEGAAAAGESPGEVPSNVSDIKSKLPAAAQGGSATRKKRSEV
jgi:hypothetical protein